VAFSPEDAEELGRAVPGARRKIQCLGPAVRCRDLVAPEVRRRLRAKWGLDPEGVVLVFAGNLDYPPNAEALEILARDVAPRLRRAAPRLQFVVAGAGGQAASAAADPMFRYAGHVTDDQLAELLQLADIVPAPMQRGSGVSIKILEAMGAGTAVVTTPAGTRGLQVEAGRHLLVAADPEEMASEITRLAADEPRRRSLGMNGRHYVLEHHAPEHVAAVYSRIYDEILCRG
jgi:glycosyltransferase involved in cell wall biosynthesis